MPSSAATVATLLFILIRLLFGLVFRWIGSRTTLLSCLMGR